MIKYIRRRLQFEVCHLRRIIYTTIHVDTAFGSQKFNVKIQRFFGNLSLENAFESGFL